MDLVLHACMQGLHQWTRVDFVTKYVARAVVMNIGQDPIVSEHGSKVTHISFSPLAPHDYAVSASSRISLFDAATCELRKSLTRFRAECYSANYRSDGKLLVAGGEDPIVQVVFHDFGLRISVSLQWKSSLPLSLLCYPSRPHNVDVMVFEYAVTCFLVFD
jgi:hypothetical protein